jgi:hypothetical protein
MGAIISSRLPNGTAGTGSLDIEAAAMSELAPSYAELKLAEDEASELRAKNKELRAALDAAIVLINGYRKHEQTVADIMAFEAALEPLRINLEE